MIDILTAALCINLRSPAEAPAPFGRSDGFRALVGMVLLVSLLASLSYGDRHDLHDQTAGLRASTVK